jgi:N-acetylglucosaminyl-diphospho-decaprenol L-rhamnosyltransferase
MRVDCAIIVVSYNSARHIEALLDSVSAAADGLSFRCVVVDNNSRDDTMAIVQARSDAVAVSSGGNFGYADAINIGRSRVGPCSSVLILNPDLVLEPGSIRHMLAELDKQGVGVVVPRLLDNDGKLYQSLRREPSISRALGEALFGSHFARRPGWLSETIRDPLVYESAVDVAWAGGAALLVSADCDKVVGEWDAERFFLYSEETDFAARARLGGYRIRYTPYARVHHEDGGSGRSPALTALMAVNRVRYYRKYHHSTAAAIFRGVVVLHYLLRARNPEYRVVLKALVKRSRWRDLPQGDRVRQTEKVGA